MANNGNLSNIAPNMLNVVNESGEIIGTETREKIHRQGLLHREVAIWLYTPAGEVIFQHRAPGKDTFPDMLGASVAGHVEVGMEWIGTAIKELEEETGIVAQPEDLQFLEQIHIDAYDEATGRRNNALQYVYVYLYTGTIKDLRVEAGKAIGFESWPLKKLLSLTPEQSKRFIFPLLEPYYPGIFRQILQLAENKEIMK